MRSLVAIAAVLVGLCAAIAPDVRAANYPTHTVKIIVPFPAGGVTDIATRVIAQKLSERLGQQFFIENIGGAGGNIGMADAAHAAGDGYTILFASSSIVVNPNLYKKVPFDVAKDFIPVTKAGASPNAWMVNSDFPAKTMKDLIALFRANPGKYSVASPGTGTTPSLSIEVLKQDLGVSFVTVPFAGGGPMIQSVLGGFTPITCAAIGNSVPLIKQGKIRALAITTKEHLETLPDVPTLDEIGIKNEQAETMTGVFVPRRNAAGRGRSAAKGDCGNRSNAGREEAASRFWRRTDRGLYGGFFRQRQKRNRQMEARHRDRQDRQDLRPCSARRTGPRDAI